MWDVIIVGAGPAGLSAALVLGRCRRSVLVCDSGHPRNARAPAMHAFLSREGIAPADLLQTGRAELERYPSVTVRSGIVSDARVANEAEGAAGAADGFVVQLVGGAEERCRKLLLATGVVDVLPTLDGLDPLYGTSVWHCPYCDGWEARDQPLAVYGNGEQAAALALELTLWTGDLVLCSDGPAELSERWRDRLQHHSIPVRQERIARLEGTAGRLERIVFADGQSLARTGMFLATARREHSDLAARLGCDFTQSGTVRTGEYETTCVEDLFVAGDASRRPQLAIVAAAEGATAAFAINTQLLKEDLARHERDQEQSQEPAARR